MSVKPVAGCGCSMPRRANYYVEVIYSTYMDTKDAGYYLCAEHVPCEDSVPEWFAEHSGYGQEELAEIHESSVTFIR